MPKKITIGTYDKKHRENLAKRAKKVQQLYEAAIGRIMGKAASALADTDAEKEFRFDDFPALNKEMDALMQDLADSLLANIEQGDEESWTLANTKNDAMVDSIIGRKRLPQDTVAEWKHPHLEALSAFINRKEAGMNLSKSVWNLSEQFKTELELALELGMGQGKSAAALSRDVRQYLKYPDKLFRRVRDKSGALRLSKAAAAFHPGRGVYRSSYKNALRMTATENNIAYRTADHNRWQALPFVLGIEVRISNNHPVTDICDTFDGKRFPKDFKFTGWHPWCRCYAVSVLASQEELDAYTKAIIDGKDVSNWKFKGQIDKMPEEFTGWMKDNEQRIAKAKTMPYFLKDNKELVERAARQARGSSLETVALDSVETLKGYKAVKAYANGGRVYRHDFVSIGDSDYKKLEAVADFFARQGREVRLTPKRQWHSDFDYDEIYGNLKGTKYYGKCPDMRIDGLWYEHEGFVTENAKRAFSNMMKHGLIQSNRVVIDRSNLTDAYMKRVIRQRVRDGQAIEEIWLKEEANLRLLYKKSEE